MKSYNDIKNSATERMEFIAGGHKFGRDLKDRNTTEVSVDK